MHCIGNYSSWINPIWIAEICNSPGYGRPKDWKPDSLQEEQTYTVASNAGYDLKSVHFWLYEKSNLSFDVIPPWTNKDIHWWFTKMTPGQFTPMHSDPHTFERPCVRYWVPMQDYQPGHIFIYKDAMIKDYKLGDVFRYVDSQDVHGAANISYTTRIILQVTEYL